MPLFTGWGDNGVTTFCSGFWDTVWGVDITDLCYDHDAAYSAGTIILKLKADWNLLSGVYHRADRSDCAAPLLMEITAVAVYAVVSTVGCLWWLGGKIK